MAHRTDEQTVAAILALRRVKFTAAEIAELLDRPLSTISAVLKRNGLGRLLRLRDEPVKRYERARPGELIHIDVKKLGRIQRGAGQRVRGGTKSHYNTWLTTPPASGATPLAGTQSTSRSTTPHDWLRRSAARRDRRERGRVLRPRSGSTARYGIRVERLLTDNGSPYRSAVHSMTCTQLGIGHLRPRPYRPRTNGKAERFVRTMLEGWAYGPIYGSTQNAPQPLTAGCGATTIADDTNHPAERHRSPA